MWSEAYDPPTIGQYLFAGWLIVACVVCAVLSLRGPR